MHSTAPVMKRLGRWDKPLSDDTTDTVVDRLLSLVPFRDMNPESFPLSAPLRDLLKNDTRVRRYRKGEIVVREGDFGSSAFMVIDGAVQVVLASDPLPPISQRRKPRRGRMFRGLARLWSKARGYDVAPNHRARAARRKRKDASRIVLQDVPRVLDSHGVATLESGEFFGEIAALSRIPLPATIIAHHDNTELLEIRWQGLRDLMRNDPGLRQHIDGLYRERALGTFLAEIPFMQHLTEEVKQQVADAVVFETHGNYEWSGDYKKLLGSGALIEKEPTIVSEGDYPNGVVVIRCGFARATQRYGNGHRTLNYLGAGGVFGFEEIAHNWRNPDRCVGMQYTLRVAGYAHLLVIPAAVIEELILPTLPPDELPQSIEERAGSRSPFTPSPKKQKGSSASTSPLQLRPPETVNPGLMEFMAQRRYFNGTETMVIDMDRCTRCDDCVRACADTHDDNPRFLRHGPIHDNVMIAGACMHCADPVCMIGCPTGAIHREEFGGEVVIDETTCIGCTTCANNCPYEAIRMEEVRNDLDEIVLTTDARPILKATKCDLCVDQYGGPACVHACPHDALARLNLNTPDDLLAWLGR
jgi:Fe-S-cluster-containing dehydrogenase component/CRP-like cAMP-binding protein